MTTQHGGRACAPRRKAKRPNSPTTPTSCRGLRRKTTSDDCERARRAPFSGTSRKRNQNGILPLLRRGALLDWLRLEFGIDKPSQKLQDVAHLDADASAAEVKKARGLSKPLSVTEVRRLKAEHATSVGPAANAARRGPRAGNSRLRPRQRRLRPDPRRDRPDVANRPCRASRWRTPGPDEAVADRRTIA
jgi:hypothetical protein